MGRVKKPKQIPKQTTPKKQKTQTKNPQPGLAMVQGKELFQETTFLSSNAEKTAYSLSLHTASLFCQKDEASVLKYACTTLQHTVLS